LIKTALWDTVTASYRPAYVNICRSPLPVTRLLFYGYRRMFSFFQSRQTVKLNT